MNITYFARYNWSVSRVLRLLVGIVLLVVGFVNHDSVLRFFGLLFLLQALLNLGCMGGACAIPPGKDLKSDNK
jgi:hypothetical protein